MFDWLEAIKVLTAALRTQVVVDLAEAHCGIAIVKGTRGLSRSLERANAAATEVLGSGLLESAAP